MMYLEIQLDYNIHNKIYFSLARARAQVYE